MTLMTVEPTITVGNIVTVVSTIATVGIGAMTIIRRISRMEMKLDLLWDWFKKEHDIGGFDKE